MDTSDNRTRQKGDQKACSLNVQRTEAMLRVPHHGRQQQHLLSTEPNADPARVGFVFALKSYPAQVSASTALPTDDRSELPPLRRDVLRHVMNHAREQLDFHRDRVDQDNRFPPWHASRLAFRPPLCRSGAERFPFFPALRPGQESREELRCDDIRESQAIELGTEQDSTLSTPENAESPGIPRDST